MMRNHVVVGIVLAFVGTSNAEPTIDDRQAPAAAAALKKIDPMAAKKAGVE